jgi:hypothetical protein
MDRLEIEGTDLEVVAYTNGGGSLVVRVNKGGICVADVGIANATAEYSAEQLMSIGALTRPVLRDLKRASLLDLLTEEQAKAL